MPTSNAKELFEQSFWDEIVFSSFLLDFILVLCYINNDRDGLFAIAIKPIITNSCFSVFETDLLLFFQKTVDPLLSFFVQ